MTIDRLGHAAGSEWKPVGARPRSRILREFIDCAIKRGQIPFDRINGVRVVKIAHARIVKAWRAKQLETWEAYQAAVKAAGEAV